MGAEREKLDLLFERKIVEYTRVYSAHRDWARILGEQGGDFGQHRSCQGPC